MRISTTQCSHFQHPEFVLEADESQVPDTYLQEIATTVEGMVAGGSFFQPDQTFQVGWMMTLVQSLDASHLTLAEPDMQSFPIKWVSGLTNTLRQLMLQLFMLDSVALRQQMNPPSIRDSLIACTRYNERSFLMNRSRGDGGTVSGWFVGCLNSEHDHDDPANLTCLSVYEAYLRQQGIQAFASFPVGSMIVMDHNDGVRVFKDHEELDIPPDSFLAQWFKRH